MTQSIVTRICRGVAPIAAPLAAFVILVAVAQLVPRLLQPGVDAVFMPATETGLSTGTKGNILALQEALRRTPDDTKIIFQLCGLYMQAVRENADTQFYTRVETLLQRVDRLEPNNPEALFLRGTIAAGQHDFAVALAAAQRLTTEHPDVARYYGLLADAQVELGMYVDAVVSLQTMADLRPDYAALTRIAYIREILGDVRGAMEIMETALSDGTSAPEHAAWGLSELGRLAFGNYRTQAEIYYNEALRAYPDFAPALAGLARIEHARGNLDQARAYVQRIVDRLPLPEYAALLGDIEALAGNTAKATLFYDAVQQGFDAIAKRGTNVESERARFLAERGLDAEQNVARARAVYAKKPTIFAADTLALALYNNAEYAEASQFATKALATGSKDAVILLHAGLIQQALGNTTQAKALLRQAQAANAEYSPLAAARLREALSK